MAGRQKISILDIYEVSFLKLNGIEPGLELQAGRVVFTFEVNKRFFEVLDRYKTNEAVDVLDFVTMVKSTRSAMLTFKDEWGKGDNKYGSTYSR